MSTDWSSPKTNIFAGISDLRRALASGCKARLIRMKNEDCKYPIMNKNQDSDFRNYKFRIGYTSSINKIKSDPNMSDFEKHLALNYVSCYGTPEAVKRYYETGELTPDNYKGIGINHLVQVDDLIKMLRENFESGGDVERANMYERQYRAPEHVNDTSHFFDFFSYKHDSPYAIKKFRRKLWVVDLLKTEDQQPRTAAQVYPPKYIPKKSVLQIKEYKIVTYSVGSITNSYSISINISKEFGFK